MKRDYPKRLLSRQEVEDLYGISKRFLETAKTSGIGPAHVQVGRLVRYRPADIEHWIEKNTCAGSSNG